MWWLPLVTVLALALAFVLLWRARHVTPAVPVEGPVEADEPTEGDCTCSSHPGEPCGRHDAMMMW